MVNNILPTKDFLANRLHSSTLSNNCALCNDAEEIIRHIFIDCRIAKHCWTFIDRWWTAVDINHSGHDWCWKLFQSANNSSFKEHWKSTVATVFWTLWLNRNEFIFKNVQTNNKTLEQLLIHRSFSWCSSGGILIHSSILDWKNNPIRATKSKYKTFLCELKHNWDYHGFTDGAWNIINNFSSAGMGGYLKNKMGDIEFLFSGPIEAVNPLEAESKAMAYMIQHILQKYTEHKKIIIHTDSYTLWENIQKYRAGFLNVIPYMDTAQILDNRHIQIGHIRRHLNPGADHLAKLGLQRPNIIFG